MTINFIEGLDLVDNATDLGERGWVYNNGTAIEVNATAGKFSGRGVIINGSTSNYLTYHNAVTTYQTVSFWFKTTGNTECFILTQMSQVDQIGSIGASYMNGRVVGLSNGALALYGDGGILLGTSAVNAIQGDTWHHIEIQAYVWSPEGVWNVYVDGVLSVTATGDFWDTIQTSTGVCLHGDGTTFGNYYDDIVIQSDNSSLPSLIDAHHIHTLLPDGDTVQADWTGSYTDIDDPLGGSDGDITYISATTLNSDSKFSLSNLPVSPDTVHAVQTTAESRKTESGARGVTVYINSNTSRANGDEFAASETYVAKMDIHPLNPDGNIAWSTSSVNALELGIEITT